MRDLIKAIVEFLRRVLEFFFGKGTVQPVGKLTVTRISRTHQYIARGYNVDEYRFDWTASPSTFVEKLLFKYKVDGGAEVALPELPPSAISVVVPFTTGASVEAWVTAVGDNGTSADNEHLFFAASNEEPVAPVGPMSATWVRHTP